MPVESTPPRKRNSILSTSSVPVCFAAPTFVPVKEEHWVSDDSRRSCVLCSRSFTVFRRKHHCRACADLFCGDCSSYKLVAKDPLRVHEIVSVRVCKTCFEARAIDEGHSLHTPVPVMQAATRLTPITQSAAVTPVDESPPTTANITDHQTTAHTMTISPNIDASATKSQTFSPFVFLPAHITSHPFFLPAWLLLMSLVMVLSSDVFRFISSWFGALLLLLLLVVALVCLRVRGSPGDPPHQDNTNPTTQAHGNTHTPKTTARPIKGASKAGLKSPRTAVKTLNSPPNSPPTSPRQRANSHCSSSLSPNVDHAPHMLDVPVSPLSLPRPVLATSSSFPSLADLPREEVHPEGLILTAQERELVRRSRIGLATVIGYHAAGATGWTTRRITRTDGTGSIALTRAHELRQYDLNSPAASDGTIIVQSKVVCDPFNPSLKRRTWKGFGRIEVSAEEMFRLYLAQDQQTEWNKALIEARIIKEVPGTRTTVTISVSAPACGGAVSSREFIDSHDYLTLSRTDVTGVTHTDFAFGGVGLEEPIFAHPRNTKYVRGSNGPCGFIFIDIPTMEPTHAQSGIAVGATPPPPPVTGGSTQFVLILDTDVRGYIPKSFVERGMPDVIVDYINNLRTQWKIRKEKGIPTPPMPNDINTQ